MNESKNYEQSKLIQENDLNFEEAIKKLEKIVDKLESGGLNLEQSLQQFEKGVELVKHCNQELNKAEKKIEIVLKEDEDYGETIPFSDDNEEE